MATKFKAVIADVLVWMGRNRTHTIQDTMAAFDEALAKRGVTNKDTIRSMQSTWQAWWRAGYVHSLASMTVLAGTVMGLVTAKNAWERLQAVNGLLEIASWTQYYLRCLFPSLTAKDSKGALKGVGKDKGDLGRLFISNLPEIFEFIKNAKKRQKLSELNNTINSLIKNKDLEKIIKNFGATGQLRSILNQLYEEEENLLRIKKEIKKLERERDLGIGGSRGEIQVDYDSKIAELKKKVDDIKGKMDTSKNPFFEARLV